HGPRRPPPSGAPGAITSSTTPTSILPAGCGALAAAWRPRRPGRATSSWARSALADRLHRILPPGPVLDVGAGDGTLVEAFVRRGRDAGGLEPYASGPQPHIRKAEVEEVDGSWSAVIFWHSLEHLRSPARALSHAAGLLAPGGTLIVAVPNR